MTDSHDPEAVVERLADAMISSYSDQENKRIAREFLSVLQPGDRLMLDQECVVVPVEATKAMLQAAHDGPLMADDHNMTDKAEAWLQDIWRAMLAALYEEAGT